MAGEKTEKGTSKRREQERKKGNVVFSREVVIIATMLSSFYCFKLWAPIAFETLYGTVTKYLSLGATQTGITPNDVTIFALDAARTFALVALPLLLFTILTNVVVTMAQTKMLVSTKSLGFKLEKLNPLSGLKKMVSMKGLVEVIKAIFKIIVLLYVVYSVLREKILLFPRLVDIAPLQAMIMTWDVIMDIVLQVGILFVFLAAADYAFQWWQYEKSIKMSKQDLKDEYKQMEGDPKVKGRQRQIQQERSRQRMMQKVPQADVVIRNPTHYAIAIQYDVTKHIAPIVIAKGADSLALRIIAIAEENNVYITEDKPLARILYETVDLDREVPTEYYKAIAELLAFVYSLKKKELN